MPETFPLFTRRGLWVALFGATLIVLLIGAALYFWHEKNRITRQIHKELAAIGELKTEQIRQWREERLTDAEELSRDPFLNKALPEWFLRMEDAQLTAHLRERLSLEKWAKKYSDVLLLDTDGRVLFAASDAHHPVSRETKKAIDEAITKKSAVLSKLYRCPAGVVHIDSVAPVRDKDGQQRVLWVLRSNAESYLYPLIQSWPTPSRTAETLLVRRDGDSVVFLNELRHQSNTALSLRLPLTLSESAAVQAVLGRVGVFRGKDYRGVEVVADLRRVPHSDWFMVAKMDADELFSELTYRGGVTALFSCLFVLQVALIIVYQYRSRQVRLYRELYHSEEAKCKAEEQFRITLYSIGDAVITTDAAGIVTHMNPVAEQLTGQREAEAVGKPLTEVFHIVNEETHEEVENPVHRILREGQVVGLANHTLLVSKDGTERPIADSGAPIRDKNGVISGVVLVFRDQSEERAAEQALRASEERYRAIFENAAVGIDVMEASGRYLQVNETLARMLGYTPEELRNLTVFDLTHPDDLELSRKKLHELVEGKEQTYRIEKRYRRKNGEVIWADVSVSAIREADGELKLTIAVISDITARKQAEEQMRRNAVRLQALLDMVAYSESGTEDFLSFALDQAVKLTKSEVGYVFRYDEEKKVFHLDGWSKNVADQCRITFAQRVYELEKTGIWGEVVRQRRAIVINDFQAPHALKRGYPEGHVHVQRFLSVPVTRQGRIVAGVGVGNKPSDYDETDVKELSVFMDHVWRIMEAKQLQESERLLAAAIEQASEGVLITDTEGVIQYVNPALEAMCGYTREELYGQNPRIMKSGEHGLDFYRGLWGTITSGRTWSGRMVNRTKDGRLYHEEASIFPVKDAQGKVKHFVALKRDITEHIRLSQLLMHSQKMEAVGRLAGGVAHDFNNLLQVIQGFAELMLLEDDLSAQHREDLQRILHAVKGGADLVRRLLTFSRRSEFKPVLLNLNERIGNLHKLLVRLLPKNISIDLVLSDNLWNIRGDASQIEQILMNLAVNARDAMPDGGRLIVETSNLVADSHHSLAHVDMSVGRYVLLKVSDTGHGMDKGTLERMFEPFYTTKGLGEGTGLGLSMVYGIMQQHGGYITCASERGQGTTFNLYFPAVDELSDSNKEISDPTPDCCGSETILLADDEELVREVGFRLLTSAGYTVLTAANGQEALGIYRQEGGRIALVVLDLLMPKMGGVQCLQELLTMDPNVKVLIASGYAEISAQDLLATGAKGVVQKPFQVRQFLQLVRQTLDSVS